MLQNIEKDFKKFGYLITNDNNSRFKSLLEACKVLSYGTVIRKLNSLKKRYSMPDNKSKKMLNIYSTDILMLQKWRIKNPELYKLKNELILKRGGDIVGNIRSRIPYYVEVDSVKLKKIVESIRTLLNRKLPISMSYLVRNLSNEKSLKELEFVRRYYTLEYLDVSKVDNTKELFEDFNFSKAKRYGYNVEIINWQLKSVKDMSGMFKNCKFCPDLSNWGKHLGNVENMSKMFQKAYLINHWMDLSSWGPQLNNVENMSYMFSDIDLSTFAGKGLNNWGKYLGNVKDISYMFYECFNFQERLDSWWSNLNKLENMDYMIDSCNQDFSTLKLPSMNSNKIISAYNTVFNKCRNNYKPKIINRIMNEKNKNNKYTDSKIEIVKKALGIY